VEISDAEDDDDVTVESEGVSDMDTDATAEDEDAVIVEFESVANTDTDAPAADEDELVVKLKVVSDAEGELEAVAGMALALRLPSVEPLELYRDSVLEELEVGRPVNEDEPDSIPFDDVNVELPTLLADNVELPMLLRDDVEVERVLLEELDETVLGFDMLLLVEDIRPRLEDRVGEVDRVFGVELDRDEVEDGETEELPVALLLLLILVKLLLVLVELLVFLLDVLVLFLLVWILVSETLKELDVVAVMFFVTFLLAVN
jgi:hypothetical protein